MGWFGDAIRWVKGGQSQSQDQQIAIATAANNKQRQQNSLQRSRRAARRAAAEQRAEARRQLARQQAQANQADDLASSLPSPEDAEARAAAMMETQRMRRAGATLLTGRQGDDRKAQTRSSYGASRGMKG